MKHFKDITFGRASAEQESAYHPELIVNGFLDPWNILEKARNGPEFLFLGYKGSGKSTIGQHLRLTAESDWSLFVTHMFLSDFPYGNFAKIVTGDAEPESRFPSAWQWLLTLTLLSSIAKDHGVDYDKELQRSLETLKSVGMLPSDDLKEVVIASSRVKYKLKLLGILDIQLDPNQKKPDDLLFLNAISRLRNLLGRVDEFIEFWTIVLCRYSPENIHGLALTHQRCSVVDNRTRAPGTQARRRQPAEAQRPDVHRSCPVPGPYRDPLAGPARRVRQLECRLSSLSPLGKGRPMGAALASIPAHRR